MHVFWGWGGVGWGGCSPPTSLSWVWILDSALYLERGAYTGHPDLTKSLITDSPLYCHPPLLSCSQVSILGWAKPHRLTVWVQLSPSTAAQVSYQLFLLPVVLCSRYQCFLCHLPLLRCRDQWQSRRIEMRQAQCPRHRFWNLESCLPRTDKIDITALFTLVQSCVIQKHNLM